MSTSTPPEAQEIFKELKAVCVPLFGTSRITPSSSPTTSRLLTDLIRLLQKIQPNELNGSLISYTFLPLSTILERNASSEIPDQVLEKILVALGLLCQSWWWTCDTKIWEQVFKLCGAIIGGLEGKGKGKVRDDETKEAATRCLLALLHKRSEQEASCRLLPPEDAIKRLRQFQECARDPRFIPILGQTVDFILGPVESRSTSLQLVSLELLYQIIEIYAPEDLIPTILPGVVSTMCKVCLGTSSGKGWVNGEVVARALKVMQSTIVRAISDDICIKEGALHRVEDLEDLSKLAHEPTPDNFVHGQSRPYVKRTGSWLHGTASQLHITLNSLTPLVSHPTPAVLHELANSSATILHATPLALPQTQPLLLSFLLSLSNAIFPSVASSAHHALLKLLAKASTGQSTLLQTLMNSTADNLLALPRLLSTQADSKVEHISGLIEAVCRLAVSDENPTTESLSPISKGIGRLLGPTGGIEKWGWSLLSVLELVEPYIVVTQTSAAQLMLESNPDSPDWVSFPELTFKNITSRSTRDALENMLRALGRAAQDSCLFSVEWFINIGQSGASTSAVTALWCGCRLLEGVANISLSSITRCSTHQQKSKRLDKLARTLSKSLAELWDKSDFEVIDEDTVEQRNDNADEGTQPHVQHQKGLVPLHETLKIIPPLRSRTLRKTLQPMLHRSLCLQLLAVASGIIQARFTSLFIYVLYPVLHSLVSSVTYLSSTASATLNYITFATSYATAANLLLSNFDYALDAISRRLTRRWLDIDATKVFVVMIRLVGSDVVDRAGDVVEECFDRLDEFHGYELIVEGLVEVLSEVIKVIETDVKARPAELKSSEEDTSTSSQFYRLKDINEFFDWLPKRKQSRLDVEETVDYGPAPRKAWGKSDSNDGENKQEDESQPTDPNAGPPPTPIQALTKQIVSRSLYFLTHGSPVIRSRILNLLASSVLVLPESALLPSIHSAWPFVINRLTDLETFVVSKAALLIEALAVNVGSFMFRRIWDDVWPRFRTLLNRLDEAEASSALSRRAYGAVGTESAYTHLHRLYHSILKTMTASLQGIRPHEESVWQVILAFRRFLGNQVHEELQQCARDLFIAAGKLNPDAVWLVLSSTSDAEYPIMAFMAETRWGIEENVRIVLEQIDT
ncbi:hypothetical protein BDQ12DRAFT_633380 [Crucibulum laeve]|uniref:Armadillo-type protein n=1 Tax=Crucibulum laeve TaxID=68775 RepID=A0A5C3LYM4_9AGAR|nr:hypothetical protein BDQ12DRAFT_633380 [Crucibulum laeve]